MFVAHGPDSCVDHLRTAVLEQAGDGCLANPPTGIAERRDEIGKSVRYLFPGQGFHDPKPARFIGVRQQLRCRHQFPRRRFGRCPLRSKRSVIAVSASARCCKLEMTRRVS